MVPDASVHAKLLDEVTMIIRLSAADLPTCSSKSSDGVEVVRV